MPRVVKLYNKSKGSLAHNQGPSAPVRLAMGPRPPKPPKQPRASQIDCSKFEMGSEAWENCMRRKRARLAADIKD